MLDRLILGASTVPTLMLLTAAYLSLGIYQNLYERETLIEENQIMEQKIDYAERLLETIHPPMKKFFSQETFKQQQAIYGLEDRIRKQRVAQCF